MKTTIEEKDATKRLDVFLTEYFENKYRRKKLSSFAAGFVFVNNKIQKPSYKLKTGDIVELNDDELNNYFLEDNYLKPFKYKLDILFEDDDLIVLNKPKNMLSHPTKFERRETLVNALIYHCGDNLSDIGGQDRLGIVHRLDKNTSGLMLAAKTNFAHENLAAQIKEKSAKRKYLAIALGEFETQEGIIDKPLLHYIKDNVKMTVSKDGKGLSAITNYKVLEQFRGAALVELELKTGRTHQIRAHLASINHPVFGDSMYGAKGLMRNEFYNLKTQEQLLQSYYLSFCHPKTGEKMEFQLEEEKFSEDFIKVLKFLKRSNNV